MGSYASSFAPIGKTETDDESQERLGDVLRSTNDEPRLGDLLAGKFSEVDVDSVEAVRELREDE